MRRLLTIGLMVAALSTVLVASPARADEHYADANGCSVPEGVPWDKDRPGGFNFHGACDQHDLCYVNHWYGHSEWGRSACDNAFVNAMTRQVNAQAPWWNPVARSAGYAWAEGYYRAVRVCGSQPFWDANPRTRNRVRVWRCPGVN